LESRVVALEIDLESKSNNLVDSEAQVRVPCSKPFLIFFNLGSQG
jgi:hypothetical protein